MSLKKIKYWLHYSKEETQVIIYSYKKLQIDVGGVTFVLSVRSGFYRNLSTYAHCKGGYFWNFPRPIKCITRSVKAIGEVNLISETDDGRIAVLASVNSIKRIISRRNC